MVAGRVDRVGRAVDMVGRAGRAAGGSCCCSCCSCCCFRKAGKGMEMVDSHILRLYLRTTVLRR